MFDTRSQVVAVLMVGAIVFGSRQSNGQFLSQEEVRRQVQILEQVKKSLAAASTNASKVALIEQTLMGESDVSVRRRVVALSEPFAGPELETFLVNRLNTEKDAGLRSQAATILGRTGSEKCLEILLKLASSDRTTPMQMGSDMMMKSSARRAATFAVAELASRFPKVADQAAAQLRALSATDDPKDHESLYDAREQALYQITRDEVLLKPYLAKLKSPNVKERIRGIAAFQFFKLSEAPPEVIQALQDPDLEVRRWAVLVLGIIGDAGSVKLLLNTAEDTKMDSGMRRGAIYSLGHIRAKSAASLMETLITDETVSSHAAVALYRITGKKTKQFPEGYNADY